MARWGEKRGDGAANGECCGYEEGWNVDGPEGRHDGKLSVRAKWLLRGLALGMELEGTRDAKWQVLNFLLGT